MTRRTGFFLLFGPPGSWKTTEALDAFQDAVLIAPRRNVHQYYSHVHQKQAVRRPIVKEIVIDQYSIGNAPIRFDDNGRPVMMPQRSTFEELVDDMIIALEAGAAEGDLPFRNLIVDEISVFWERFFLEIVREMNREGNKDGRAHHQRLQMWTREVIDRLFVALRHVNLIMIGQDRSPGGGKSGGVYMPNDRTTSIFGADAHLGLLSGFEPAPKKPGVKAFGGKDPAVHVWKAFQLGSTAKARGITAERLDELKYNTLSEIVAEAGFDA